MTLKKVTRSILINQIKNSKNKNSFFRKNQYVKIDFILKNYKQSKQMKNFKHVLIVLGCGPKRDGKPSQCMISRARKAIQLHKKNNYSAILPAG